MAQQLPSKKFAKSCILTFHDVEADITDHFDIDQRRYVSADEKRYIISENLMIESSKKNMKTRKLHVCDVCLDKVKQMMANPSKKIRQSSTSTCSVEALEENSVIIVTDDMVEKIAADLEAGTLPTHQLNAIMKAVGTHIRNCFLRIKPSTSSNERLAGIKMTSYLDVWDTEKNREWKDMLELICGRRGEIQCSTARKFAKCTELVRSEIDRTFISNVALAEAMLLLQFSHSKYAVDVFCRGNAAGSFSTVRRTMALLGSNKFILPNNDVIIAFDNNQVIQKTWMFKYGGKQVVSTVTTMACFDKTTNTSRHQFGTSISTSFFPSDENKMVLMKRLIEFTESANQTCRSFRKSFIESRLKKLVLHCNVSGDKVIDMASTTGDMTTYDGSTDEVFSYNRVPSVNRECIVKDMECLPENPNSYKAVAHVLDNILEHLSTSYNKDRVYIPVYMDGAPFVICMKLIRSQYICNTCKAEVHSEKVDEHIGEKHKDESRPTWSRKYKRIVIRPGGGHTEMICVKAILSTFWIAFIKPIASILGYNSESQLQYCMKGYDHHKAYNILMVVYAALSYELFFPYIQDELLNKNVPSYESYCSWAREREKTNLLYKLASDFCFTTLHALHLFRCGIRTCNDEVSLHARHKLTTLLYACNNLKYQEILCYDTWYLLSLPPEIRSLISEESSRTRGSDVGEGYDFLLENRNKLYKSFLPSDSSPTFEQWLQVTKTANELEEIRDIACHRLDLNMKASSQRPKKFQEEILEARKLIRRHGLLLKQCHGLTAIDNENTVLDDCFENYILHAERNRNTYYNSYLNNELTHLPLLNTGIEPQIRNCNDEELTDVLKRKIALLREPFYSFYKKAFKKSLPKEDKINLYRAVHAQIKCQQDADYEAILSDAFQEYISIFN